MSKSLILDARIVIGCQINICSNRYACKLLFFFELNLFFITIDKYLITPLNVYCLHESNWAIKINTIEEIFLRVGLFVKKLSKRGKILMRHFVTGEYTQKCIYLRTNAVSLLCNFSRSLPPTTFERNFYCAFHLDLYNFCDFFSKLFSRFYITLKIVQINTKINQIRYYLCKTTERMNSIYSKTHLRLNQHWMKTIQLCSAYTSN